MTQSVSPAWPIVRVGIVLPNTRNTPRAGYRPQEQQQPTTVGVPTYHASAPPMPSSFKIPSPSVFVGSLILKQQRRRPYNCIRKNDRVIGEKSRGNVPKINTTDHTTGSSHPGGLSMASRKQEYIQSGALNPNYELIREPRVNGGRPGPPSCHGRLPLRSLIMVRRFRK